MWKRKIFLSYSRKDQVWLEMLKKNLIALEEYFEIWDDSEISAGEEWAVEIDQAIQECYLAILLVSADYLESDFIRTKELPSLFKRAESGYLKIVWFPVSASVFAETDLGRIQSIWDPNKPLDMLSEPEQKSALAEISLRIRDSVEIRTYDRPKASALRDKKRPYFRVGAVEKISQYNIDLDKIFGKIDFDDLGITEKEKKIINLHLDDVHCNDPIATMLFCYIWHVNSWRSRISRITAFAIFIYLILFLLPTLQVHLLGHHPATKTMVPDFFFSPGSILVFHILFYCVFGVLYAVIVHFFDNSFATRMLGAHLKRLLRLNYIRAGEFSLPHYRFDYLVPDFFDLSRGDDPKIFRTLSIRFFDTVEQLIENRYGRFAEVEGIDSADRISIYNSFFLFEKHDERFRFLLARRMSKRFVSSLVMYSFLLFSGYVVFSVLYVPSLPNAPLCAFLLNYSELYVVLDVVFFAEHFIGQSFLFRFVTTLAILFFGFLINAILFKIYNPKEVTEEAFAHVCTNGFDGYPPPQKGYR